VKRLQKPRQQRPKLQRRARARLPHEVEATIANDVPRREKLNGNLNYTRVPGFGLKLRHPIFIWEAGRVHRG
jgi:hypothetical protein